MRAALAWRRSSWLRSVEDFDAVGEDAHRDFAVWGRRQRGVVGAFDLNETGVIDGAHTLPEKHEGRGQCC